MTVLEGLLNGMTELRRGMQVLVSRTDRLERQLATLQDRLTTNTTTTTITPTNAPMTKSAGEPSTQSRTTSGIPGTLSTPVKSASKYEWANYATTRGMSRADADALTKEELVARYADEKRIDS